MPVGEVDLASAPTLQDCLRELIDVGFQRLKLDLSRVSFLDCAGLRVLIGAWSRAQHAGARLDVLHARGQVARLLALDLAEHSPLLGWTARATLETSLEPIVSRAHDTDTPSSTVDPLHGDALLTGIGPRR